MRRLVAVALVAFGPLGACASGGNTPVLTDGVHVGYVTAIDPTERVLTFDEAPLLGGAAAIAAARRDGTVVTERGRYIDDAVVDPRKLELGDAITVRLLRPCCALHRVAFADWLGGFEPDARSFYGTSRSIYGIRVSGGRVVAVDEVLVR